MTRALVGASWVLCLTLAVSRLGFGQTLPRVVIQTTLGSIEVEVDTVRAPLTGSHFLRHVNQGSYRGGQFHRTVRQDKQPADEADIEIVQAGPDPVRSKSFAPAPRERTTDAGLSHRDGTVSMAGDGPDFFIYLGDQPALKAGGKRSADSQGTTVFGRVVGGMDVVRQIQTARAVDQRLTPPIGILDIVRASEK